MVVLLHNSYNVFRMAPESLRDYRFTFKTDVWSYGVTLWEMYTFGDVPFAAVNPTNLLNLLDNGGRLPRGDIPEIMSVIPKNKTNFFSYSLILRCWAGKPEERSRIEDLKGQLTHILSAHSQYYGYVCLSESADSLSIESEPSLLQ